MGISGSRGGGWGAEQIRERIRLSAELVDVGGEIPNVLQNLPQRGVVLSYQGTLVREGLPHALGLRWVHFLGQIILLRCREGGGPRSGRLREWTQAFINKSQKMINRRYPQLQNGRWQVTGETKEVRGGWRLAAGGWRWLETNGVRLGWRLVAGCWRLEAGGGRREASLWQAGQRGTKLTMRTKGGVRARFSSSTEMLPGIENAGDRLYRWDGIIWHQSWVRAAFLWSRWLGGDLNQVCLAALT